MDFANRAKCFALRFPGRGKAVPIAEIIQKKLVKKMDGTVPTQGAISDAANHFLEEKEVTFTSYLHFGAANDASQQ